MVREEDAYAPSISKASRPAAAPNHRSTQARVILHFAAENFPAPGKILGPKTRAQQDRDGIPPAVRPNAQALPTAADESVLAEYFKNPNWIAPKGKLA